MIGYVEIDEEARRELLNLPHDGTDTDTNTSLTIEE